MKTNYAKNNDQIQRNKDLIVRYKSEIDLVSYLSTVGYEPDRKHYSTKWPVMKNEATGHKLLVGRNSDNGQYFYRNPNDSKDSGTIIELISVNNRLDLSSKEGWRGLHETCSAMIGDAYFNSHDHVRPRKINEHTREAAVTQYFKLDPLKNTDYLQHERRLTPETIHAPEFKNKVFNKSFIDKTLMTAGKNTVFPIENEKGIIGVMNRNTVWNQIQGSKDNGVWVSNILPDVPVKAMVISEAPIDSMSYHQLNPPAKPGEQLYVATAGSLSATQPMTIQYLINQTKPEKLILANDNDFQGIRFNINLMGKLLMPDQPNNGITTLINNSRHSNTFIIEVNKDQAGKAGLPTDINDIIKRIDAVMNRGFTPETAQAQTQVMTERSDTAQIQVVFPNIRPLLMRAANLTSELRQVGEGIQIKRAIENDWNEDVQIKAVKGQVQTEQGIKLTTEQTLDIIKQGKSGILLNGENDAGKLALDFTKEGVTTQFLKREPVLMIPPEYMGVTLTAKDADNLRKLGDMGRRIEITHPRTGETQAGYLGVDADLNKLVFLRADRLKSEGLYAVRLDNRQTKQVVSGEVIEAEKKIKGAPVDTPGIRVEVRVSAQKGEIIVSPLDSGGGPNQALDIRQNAAGPTPAGGATKQASVETQPVKATQPGSATNSATADRPATGDKQTSSTAPGKDEKQLAGVKAVSPARKAGNSPNPAPKVNLAPKSRVNL